MTVSTFFNRNDLRYDQEVLEYCFIYNLPALLENLNPSCLYKLSFVIAGLLHRKIMYRLERPVVTKYECMRVYVFQSF